jgi:hypothetical protein
MGNAVDKENITRRLEEFAEAGIGGVEITPIFGTKGYEDHFLTHLSEGWMEMPGNGMALWRCPGRTRICCRQALHTKL